MHPLYLTRIEELQHQLSSYQEVLYANFNRKLLICKENGLLMCRELLGNGLRNLLAAPSIKYSAWPPSDTTSLRTSGGVYHFYELDTKKNISLYVGKAGLGAGSWNLFKRLSQHFQTSQTNTLLGKASKASGTPPEATRTSFCQRPIHLQWLTIATQSHDLQAARSELFRLECFCKAVLNPAFTDA